MIKRFKFFSGLRASIQIIVLLAIVPAMALIIRSGLEISGIVQEKSREDTMLLALTISNRFSQTLEGIRYLLVSIATSDQIKNADPGASWYLSSLMKKFDHIANLGATDTGGVTFASGLALKGPVNLSDRSYFKNAMKRKDFSSGEFQVGRITGLPTINFGYPVTGRSGSISGIVFAAYDLSHAEDLLSGIPAQKDADMVLLDRLGLVLYSNHYKFNAKGTPFYNRRFIRAVTEGKKGHMEVMGPDGEARLYAYMQVQACEGIYCAVGLPVRRAVDAANRSLVLNILFLGVAAVLAMGLAAFLGDVFIGRMINRLIETTEKVAGGSLEARSGIDYSAGELGLLAGSFDRMAETLGKRETELRVSEEKYRSIVENTHEGILIIDAAYRIIFANSKILEISGYDQFEQLGSNFLNFVDDEFKAEVADRYERRKRGEDVPSVYDASIIRKDGAKRNLEIRVSSIRTASGEMNYIVHLIDTTERREAEEARRKLEMQILQTQKLESLGVLAGGIAHDFNNILTAVMGHADLALLELPKGSTVRDGIEEIVKASNRAADLCRQMLAYSGKAMFILENLDLNELIDEMVHLLKTSISKKAVLNLDLQKDLPPIRGDATQIRQIVMNLITNASESLGDSIGTISIATGSMHCEKEYLSEFTLGENLQEGVYAYLSVSDTGSGMESETLSRIFEPFFTTKFTGRGLGLAAVMGIVRGHQGGFRVYSEPGRGTCFKIILPSLAASDDGKMEARHAGPPRGDSAPISGTILLVDDEESVRLLGRRMLEKIGFSVLEVENGQKALELFRERLDEIVCIILDLTMPLMDGAETFREIRKINDSVPVIISSGYTQQDVAQLFTERGFSGFIQKPYMMESFENEIRRVLSRGNGGSDE